VILKWAQSLDGKIATRTGDSKWISCEKSRVLAHRIRGRMDAVVVGVGTVIADDPMLTCRDARTYRQATRVVLDPKLRTPQKAALICSADQVPTIIVTDRHKFAGAKASRLKKRGAEIIGVHSTSKGLDLRDLLDELGRRSMTNIMVEGGGKTLGAFFDQQLADEAVVFVAPKLIGGADAISPLAGLGSASMHDIPLIRDIQVRRAGQDHVYRFRFDR